MASTVPLDCMHSLQCSTQCCSAYPAYLTLNPKHCTQAVGIVSTPELLRDGASELVFLNSDAPHVWHGGKCGWQGARQLREGTACVTSMCELPSATVVCLSVRLIDGIG